MKKLALLLPLLALAASPALAEDPATNAPALLPGPLSALRLGMTESELRAVRPDARPGNDELVPGFFEELREGAFQHAVYLVEDAPGGGALAAVMLVGEPPEGKTSADAFAAVSSLIFAIGSAPVAEILYTPPLILTTRDFALAPFKSNTSSPSPSVTISLSLVSADMSVSSVRRELLRR
jgi:hypothetical protein